MQQQWPPANKKHIRESRETEKIGKKINEMDTIYE